MRREGATSAAAARKLWEARRWKLPEIDRVRRASGAELVAELHDRLGALFGRSYVRRAAHFAAEELEDPRALRAGQQALADLHALAAADPGLELDHERVRERLERIEVQLGEGARPDRVQVTDPEAVRARRFEAVFVCGLQEGEFPRGESAEPFLSDDDRRAIADASGLVLAPRGDRLDRERHLFYVCCSRAERTLALSSRFADEQGAPQVQSFLLEEVRDLFGEISRRCGARSRTSRGRSTPPRPLRSGSGRSPSRPAAASRSGRTACTTPPCSRTSPPAPRSRPARSRRSPTAR